MTLSMLTDAMVSDGFSAGGTNLLFESNYVVNGDDCLTVGSGAKDIVFRFETKPCPSYSLNS